MPVPLTSQRDPVLTATGTIVVTCATGMPTLSISCEIADPQRVLVPQVDVRITACTLALRSFAAIPRPISRAFAKGVATPDVLKIVS